jgi:hypothetical protein
MKNNKLILLVGCIITGCAVTEPTKVPSPTTSPNSVVNVTNSPVLPSSSPSALSTPSSVVTSSTPTPIVTSNPYELSKSGLINITNSYIETPDSAFLVNDEFNLKILFSFNSLPEKDTIISLFNLFDNSTSTKKSHFSLDLDFNKNLILKAQNTLDVLDKSISFPSVEINKAYELNFVRTKDKIELIINGNKIFSNEFKNEDFIDGAGKRKLHIGGNSFGENRISATIDYIDVQNSVRYNFNNSLADDYKYGLDALINSGTFTYINDIISSSPTPIVTSSPTSIPTPDTSSTPVPDRNVTDTSGTATIELGVYNSKDNAQYVECLNKREKALKDNPNINIDCLNETGVYTTPGFDLATAKFINSERGDLRFITEIIRDANSVNNSKIIVGGSDITPKVSIIDLGLKSFEGLTVSDLKDRVDYNLSNRIFSQSTISSQAIIDHVYAIRTNRYGKEPRYAKIIINDIITDDHIFIPLKAPEISVIAQYISYSGKSGFSPNKSYSYYISTFDGVGETGVDLVGNLSPNNNAENNIVKMEIKVPYGAKGYSLYRRDNSTSQIYKIGPILSKVDQTIEVLDKGDKGYLVDSFPNSNTTVKNGFRPARDSKPLKINFTYRFDGNGDLSF